MGESDEKFQAIGNHLTETLVRYGQLRPKANVLDVGSGYGRLPHALLRYQFNGSYLGLDVLDSHVRWCARNLRHPSYRFQRIDVQNGRYNPEGTEKPDDIDLGDATFQSIAVFSVFTHMWPGDVSAYLRLLSAHLDPAGKIAATFFLFDEEWTRSAELDGARILLPHRRTPFCRYESEEDPLHYVGYDLDWLRAEADSCGLALARDPVYGTWSGRSIDPEEHPGYQDIVSFERA